MESDTPEVAEQNTSSSKLAPVSLTPVSSLTRVPAGLVPISSIASVGITVLPSARVPPKGVPADVAPTEICEQKVTTIEQNDFFVSESNEVEMAKPSTNSVSALLASLEPAPSTAFLTEDNQHVVDHITRAEAEAEAEATSALPASSATISPIPIKKRIVKPDGSTSSRIPVGSDANRPKTPLRARPSSAGRLQGNPVPNSAAPRSSVDASPSSGKTPSFQKETKAWKHRTLAEEELEKMQSLGGMVSSSLTKSGPVIAPISTNVKHHYERSTASSSSMDEAMAERIRELRAVSAGTSVHPNAPATVSREQGAVTKSRGTTPQRQRPSSAGPRARPVAPVNPNAKPVYSRLYDAQAEMNKKLEVARNRQIEQESKELTFKPTLYSTPPSNLHARGDIKAVTVSKDHSPAAFTPEAQRTPNSASPASHTIRGPNLRTPPNDKHPPSRGSAPRSLVGGRPSANQTDVFDRLSKLTTASLQADNYVAPAPAPTFSGGSIVPEDHPSLAQMTTHPSFGASREIKEPVVKIKYVPPAVAIPHVRTSTEKTPESSPVRALKTKNNLSGDKMTDVENHMSRLRDSLSIEPTVPLQEAPGSVSSNIVTDIVLEPQASKNEREVGETSEVVSVDDVAELAAERNEIDEISTEMIHDKEKSEVLLQADAGNLTSVRSPKNVDSSPLKKMADNKAAYDALLQDTISETEIVFEDNFGDNGSTVDKRAVCTRQDSSGNVPISVPLGSVGGAAGVNTSKHVQKMKRGALPKRRLSGTALSVDDLNTALNEGRGEVDRGGRDVLSKEVTEQSETVENISEEQHVEIQDRNDDAQGRTGSVDVDDASKDTIDRMLLGFKIESNDDLDNVTY